MNELWNLLWSGSQQAFHIERVSDTRKANLSAFLESRRMDYVTMLVGTDDECHAEADRLRPHLHAQRRSREVTQGVIDAMK